MEQEYLHLLYESQASHLNKTEMVRAGRLSVVDFRLLEMASGKVRSHCTVAETDSLLLPKTDYLTFTGPATGRILARSSWSRVEKILDAQMEKTGFYPDRYLLKKFPDAQQLSELGIEPL